MKRFIIGFIITILFLAFAIGQCNNTAEEDAGEMVSLYSYTEEENEEEEDVVIPAQEIEEKNEIDIVSEHEETVGKNVADVDGIDVNGIVLLPSNIPSQLLSRTAYCLSYNKETRCPNWVAWHLTAEHADGEWARSNDYREDFDVPAPRATNEDYRGSSWSRGHMCPAGDCKWDANAMSETFLLSNMCPQDRSLNSGLWNRIEMDCRKWAQRYGSVYVVCGPLLYNKEHETIGVNKVAVPEAFFKVILCMKGKPKAIGFVVKNNPGTKKKDQYVNTVDEVERLTGYDFFPALPDSIEKKVESYSNIDDWR